MLPELISEIPGGSLNDAGIVAMSAIRSFCGWHVAPVVTETLTLDVPAGDVLQLPTRHVVEKPTVEISGHEVEVLEWSPSGLVRVPRFRSGIGTVKVTLRHGYEWAEVPDLLAVFERLKERVSWNASDIRSQTAGPFSVSYATLEGAPIGGTLAMLASEREILNHYRVKWGV